NPKQCCALRASSPAGNGPGSSTSSQGSSATRSMTWSRATATAGLAVATPACCRPRIVPGRGEARGCPANDRSLRIHARILLGDGFCIRSAANSLQIKIGHRFPSYASANCRSTRAAYPAVCGKRVTLPGDVDRKRNLDGTEQPSWMLSAQVGRGDANFPRVLDRWAATGRCADATAEKAVPFPRCPSILSFAALNPFYGDRCAYGGEGIGVIRRQRGCVRWVEPSEAPHEAMPRGRGHVGTGGAA